MKLFSLPAVAGVVSFLSGLWAAPGAAQGLEAVTAIAHSPEPMNPIFVQLMPIIVAAAMGGGTALVAWMVKTFLGISIEAFCTFGETWADAKLASALANQDPRDDIPAMAFTKAIKAMCSKLRAAEKTIPGNEKNQ